MKAAKVAAITVPLVLLAGLGYGAYRFFGSGFKANRPSALMKQTEPPTATGPVPETDSVVGTPEELLPSSPGPERPTSTENLTPARATSSPEILLPAVVTSTESATSTDSDTASSTEDVSGELKLPVVTSTETPTSTEANQAETATATN